MKVETQLAKDQPKVVLFVQDFGENGIFSTHVVEELDRIAFDAFANELCFRH